METAINPFFRRESSSPDHSKKRKREEPLDFEILKKKFIESELDETEFKKIAALNFFVLAMGNRTISDLRKSVIQKSLKIPDLGICGKCRHPRLNKGYLNVHDEFCCTQLFLNLKESRLK